MNEWIELADGTRIPDAYVVSLGEERIAIYAAWPGTFFEAAAVFCDPEKTREILSWQYGDAATWEGFIIPDAMQLMDTGVLTVTLNKGVEQNV